MSKFFIDTEFIEDGRTIDLISIGIVCEDGREYYAISNEFDASKASDWVRKNVIDQLEPKIQGHGTFWKPHQHIREDILAFVHFADPLFPPSSSIEKIEKPEFWAYYADYDWVVFCQLFGTMMDLPKSFPMYCRDIKQECDRLGNPKLPNQKEGEHNALEDARWNKKAWEFLQTYESCLY